MRSPPGVVRLAARTRHRHAPAATPNVIVARPKSVWTRAGPIRGKVIARQAGHVSPVNATSQPSAARRRPPRCREFRRRQPMTPPAQLAARTKPTAAAGHSPGASTSTRATTTAPNRTTSASRLAISRGDIRGASLPGRRDVIAAVSQPGVGGAERIARLASRDNLFVGPAARPCGQATAGGAVNNEEEFSAFVRARSAELQRTAWLMTGDWAAAQDLVQSALVKTWQRWATIRRQDAPEIYTRRVMLTTFLGWRG